MKIHWLALALLILGSACKSEKEGVGSMSRKDDAGTTHCIGRSLITLPSTFVETSVATGIFKLKEGIGEQRAFDVVVRSGVLTVNQYKAEVQRRRAKLKAEEDGNLNNLRLDKEIGEGANLFRVQEIDDAYVSELDVLRGTSMVTVRLESYHETYREAEENLIKLIERVQENTINGSSNKEGGFCLGGVTLAGHFSLESGSFLFRDGKGASYNVEIDTFAPDAETPLNERMSGPDSLLAVFNVNHKVLRARERTVSGMRAQEWLGWAKVSDEPDGRALKFALNSMREKPSRVAPHISLTFETAQPLEDGRSTETLISDDEALRQWDVVVDSIRPAGI